MRFGLLGCGLRPGPTWKGEKKRRSRGRARKKLQRFVEFSVGARGVGCERSALAVRHAHAARFQYATSRFPCLQRAPRAPRAQGERSSSLQHARAHDHEVQQAAAPARAEAGFGAARRRGARGGRRRSRRRGARAASACAWTGARAARAARAPPRRPAAASCAYPFGLRSHFSS